jgi:hypothetical protein
MPKNAEHRFEEIKNQEGVPEEIKREQKADVNEAYGEKTRLGRESVARAIDPDDDGAILERQDLLDGALSFDSTPHEMAGALHLAGKNRMTRSEAREALRAFRTSEVE